jgi:hypothetical protein
MSKSLTAWSCRVSLAECSRSSFALTIMCRFLSLPLPVMLLTAVSEKSTL